MPSILNLIFSGNWMLKDDLSTIYDFIYCPYLLSMSKDRQRKECQCNNYSIHFSLIFNV